MKAREFLQIELWSKETSRKIVARVRKVLVRIGIVSGVLVVGVVILFAIEVRWLTSGERNAARAALAEIDTLQNLDSAGEGDFIPRDLHAKERVQAAEQASWTGRDRWIANSLSIYLLAIESGRRDVEMRRMMQQRNMARTSSDLEFDKTMDEMNSQTRLLFRSILHKELK